MPKLTVEGVGTFDVPAGKRLVLALEDEAKVDQLHACGGNARCTTCRVEFVAGEPPQMTAAGVRSAAAGQPADGADRHVVVAENLATEPDARQPLGGQDVPFGDGHPLGFAGHKLDPAGGAARVAAAGVELVHMGLVFQGQDQALVQRDLELSDSFDRQARHDCILPVGLIKGINCPWDEH